MLLTSTALAQQHSSGYASNNPAAGYRNAPRQPDREAWRAPDYRRPGMWNQPGPVLAVAPLFGLLSLLLAPPAVVVPVPVAAEPGARLRNQRDARSHLGPPDAQGGPNQPGTSPIH